MVNQTSVPRNAAKAVYFYGVMNGGKEESDHVYRMYRLERRMDERDALLGALGASRDSLTLSR